MISKPENPSVQAVWQGFDRKVFPEGATIFAEGDMGAAAYILLRGDVTLLAGPADKKRTLTELKPGQMFGVHALMAGARRGATAFTKQGCEVLTVSEDKLKQKLDEADPFVRYWVDYLSKRIIELSAQ
ncbi:Crp/Fnr family transcriptional regulator [Bradyrhizobium lablabi]|uniref:Crp/Fnr family transcriptional regulator n=1 Tax=Bradyrhizobium lablabi TaxID=722472 RepID=UPI001BA96057|nr:Crp/Fnr family transcriptional regulator [Bradyrhizobium lablabi]MBR0694471.1 Crp/Fnr family transcriptional regulator [Bradyrhizobium lablabi]